MYREIEELTLNTWPAQQTLLMNGWLIRYAEGFTKRSNSVSPLYGPGAGADLDTLIRRCEDYYSDRKLDTIFKLTPYVMPDHLDHMLELSGYVKVDESKVLLLSLDDIPEPALVAHISDRPDDGWLEALAAFNRLSDQHKELTRRLLSMSSLRQRCFTLLCEGQPVACGLGVIQNGYVGLYDIVTNERFRRRGYAEQLVLNILAWGKANGAVRSFLQVVRHNEAALRLYEKLGYREAYPYWYRVKRYGVSE